MKQMSMYCCHWAPISAWELCSLSSSFNDEYYRSLYHLECHQSPWLRERNTLNGALEFVGFSWKSHVFVFELLSLVKTRHMTSKTPRPVDYENFSMNWEEVNWKNWGHRNFYLSCCSIFQPEYFPVCCLISGRICIVRSVEHYCLLTFLLPLLDILARTGWNVH
jgi:hypothetical protein